MKPPTLPRELHNLAKFHIHNPTVGYGRLPSVVFTWVQSQCAEHHQLFGWAQLTHNFVIYCYGHRAGLQIP